MITSYLECPQKAFYDSVLKMEETAPFFAAILGTAGHQVIFDAHATRKGDSLAIAYGTLSTQFADAFRDALNEAKKMPQIGEKFDSVDEVLQSKMPEYIQMISGYLQHKGNADFHSTLHEQLFVLQISCPELSDYPFIFTGTIDQAGYNNAGQVVLRDIKFRADNFKPGFTDLSLNHQLTIYAYALRHGVPACRVCRPTYDQSDFSVVYNGPCDNCLALIGTNHWPQKYPQICQLVWMRDFLRRVKDEHPREIDDPKKRKVKSPVTNRMVKMKVANPAYIDGYKAGDYKGQGLITTSRGPAALNVLMSDVLRAANSIRNAVFFRNPSKEKCGFWCRHKENCVKQIELEMEMTHVSQLEQGMTMINPFEE